MKITADWFLKKDNMKIVLVVVMSIVLIVVLKVRMSGGKDAGESAASMETHQTASEASVPFKKRTRDNSAAVVAQPIKADILKSPSFIKRDLFSYRSQGTDPTRKAGQMDEAELKLTATIIDARGSLAIIGNEVLGIGESINGFKIRDIKDNEVILVNGGKKYILMMTGE